LRGLHPDFLCCEFQAKSALHIVGAQHAAPLQQNCYDEPRALAIHIARSQ
jgi:hypothetical protein